MHLWSLLARAAALFGDRPATREGDATLAYRALYCRALGLARLMAEQHGVKQGDRVAVLDDNTRAFVELYFAIAGAGAVSVPLNHRLAPPELGAIARDAGAVLLFARAGRGVQAAATRLPVVEIDGAAYDAAAADDGGAFAPCAPPRDAPAHLYYTSGTTGTPKGVVLTHGNVTTHALAAIAELGLSDRDVWGHFAPLFHLADAWATFAVTWVGGQHVLLPRFAPAAALDAVARFGVTATNLVPTMLTAVLALPDLAQRRCPSLRLLLSGGAPIAPDTVRRLIAAFGCEYAQTYGMTETSPYLTISTLKAHLRALSAEQQLAYRAKTGRPFLGVELEVVDDRGRWVARDETQVGEIRVRGPTVTPGYWNQPEATAAAFDADGFLRTGDLAVVDREGFVTIVDRKKDMILTGGENVYSIEVENALYRHPAVQDAAVFGVPDTALGETVRAAVVLRPGAHASAEELVARCRQHIAGYKVPRALVLLDALPRTGSGKIDKRSLRASYLASRVE